MTTIKVIQEDIDNGIQEDPCWCPIANAIARIFRISDKARKGKIYVSPTFMRIRNKDFYNYKGEIPLSVKDFIAKFDNESAEVEPFKFEMPL